MSPWTTYTGDQHIYRGFASIGDAFQEQARRQQQQEQFDAEIGERRRAHDLQYYGGEQDRAARYYGMDLEAQEAAARMNPARTMAMPLMGPDGNQLPGSFIIPMTGQVIKTQSPGQVMDSGNVATPVYKPDGKTVYGYKLTVGGKEIFKEAKPDTGLDLGGGQSPEQKRIAEIQKEIAAKPQMAGVPSGYDLPGESRQQAIARLQRQLGLGAQPAPAPVQRSSPAPAKRPAAASTPRPAARAQNPAVEPPLPELEPAGAATPPQAAIDYLLAHPDLALDFEAKYGPGTSQQYLGK